MEASQHSQNASGHHDLGRFAFLRTQSNQGAIMKYLFIALAIIAFAFTALGALSIWAIVLAVAIKAVLMAAALISAYAIYRSFFWRKS